MDSQAKTAPKKTRTRTKTRRPRLTPEQKRENQKKRDHRKLVRDVFQMTGFTRIAKLADKEFEFKNQKSDFDDVYVYENIVVCAEYTTAKTPSDHLKPKKIVYDKIDENHGDFLDFLRSLSSDFSESPIKKYTNHEIKLRIIYCSYNSVETQHKQNIQNPVYLDYSILRYFQNLIKTIKTSARYELLDFLGIAYSDLGKDGKINPDGESHDFSGLMLHENNSNFDNGYKVVSFYADPEALLTRSYVLRKGGWRQSANVYQRLLIKSKIDSIRKHLKKNKRVFVNNIIATLPSDTKFLDSSSDTVPATDFKKSEPVKIRVPNRSNCIGLIDGQHRTFSYYEDLKDKDDQEIAALRGKQNLLVTGIIYPESTNNLAREKFEATLFLEINSNQTGAKSNLKQAIGLVLTPFKPESIATRVLNGINASTGPLSTMFEQYDFDKDKIKTSSIISFALKPLVKPSGDDSLFSIWDNDDKHFMIENEDHDLLSEYVQFCVAQINMLLSAVRSSLPSERWTTNKKTPLRFLTTLNINSILILMRHLIRNNQVSDFDFYRNKLKGFSGFDFLHYHSSQYSNMAENIYNTHFSSNKS